MSARVQRLEEAILEVVKLAPQTMQQLIRGLQALRGIAHISAVTIAAELGNISSRFASARKLMGSVLPTNLHKPSCFGLLSGGC